MSNSIGKYINEDSLAHNLNSTLKLIFLIIMLISSIFINSYKDVIMLFSYLILTLVSSGINIKIILKEISYFKYFIFFIIIINIITFSPIEILLGDLFRFIFIITYILIFMHVTTINETMYAIGRVLDPFSIKKDSKVILYTALLFRIPTIYKDELDRFNNIYKERFNNKDSVGKKIKYYQNIIIKSFNYSINRLNLISIDMKLKLFGYGKSRTNYRLNKFGIKEVLLLILNIAILVVVIIY